MQVTVEILVPWSRALDAAKATAGKEPDGKEPSSAWKRKALRAMHSPIQAVVYRVRLVDVPYYISVHLVRHHVGVTHWVSTQRPDRTGSGVSRHELPQDAPVSHMFDANAQTILAMSRKRLCGKASPETRKAWEQVRLEMTKVDPEMAEAMVPECVHCGRCTEFEPCGFCGTEDFRLLRDRT